MVEESLLCKYQANPQMTDDNKKNKDTEGNIGAEELRAAEKGRIIILNGFKDIKWDINPGAWDSL